MRHRLGGAAAALLLALCGCSGGAETSTGTPGIALVLANSELSYAKELGDGFEVGVSEVGGVNATVTGPDVVDGSRQLQMFQEVRKTADDGISVFTLHPEIFAGPIAEAVGDGIPIIAVDNPPLAAAGVGFFVGNDNYELGRMLADLVIAKLPAGSTGTIVLGTSTPGARALDRRAKGIRDRLRELLPGISVLGPFDTKQDTSANRAAWRALVKVNTTARAFVGTGDADGWNLAAIRKETGGEWVAGAFDLDPRSMAAVQEGGLVLVSPEHFTMGMVAGRLQAEHAKNRGDLPQGWYYVPGLAVDRTTVDTLLERQKSTQSITAAVTGQVDRILTDQAYRRPIKDAG
jgi:ribose transport system substrate-binding protein